MAEKKKEAKRTNSSSSINLLIENSIALQKNLVDVAISLNNLTKQISELLSIFKEAGKALMESEKQTGIPQKAEQNLELKKDIAEIQTKINNLLEQNKIISKGLLLMETAMREKLSP